MNQSISSINGLGDPRGQSYEQYVAAVRARNELLLHAVGLKMDKLGTCDEIQNVIRRAVGGSLGARVHIATIGSDGRKEKRGDDTSPLEAVLLVKRDSPDTRISNEVRMQCLDAIKTVGIFGGVLEIKDLDLDQVAYCQDYSPPAPWPTIVIDFCPLGNVNRELVVLSRELLFQEVVSDGGKPIFEAVKKRLSEARLVARRGQNSFKGETVRHFDKDSGELFYNPASPAKQGSVKYGPLRTVQMFLAYRILQFMKTHSKDKDFIQQVPGNTEEKIAILLDRGALQLNSSDAAELTQLYKYFLWCSYLSEYCYSHKGQEKVVVVPDVQLFRENLDNLLKLVELQK